MELLRKEMNYETAGILLGIILATMAHPKLFQAWEFGGALKGIDRWVLFFVAPDYAEVVFLIFFILGGFAAARLSKEFKVKIPNRKIAAEAVIGGLLMGTGIVFINTCNIGTFFGALPQLGFGAYLSGTGIIIGVYLGVRYFKRQWRRGE